MIGELSIINKWIPEQMEPGTVFVLENAGEVGEKEDPYWAVLSCPSCGTSRADYSQANGWTAADNLRLVDLFGTVLHQR